MSVKKGVLTWVGKPMSDEEQELVKEASKCVVIQEAGLRSFPGASLLCSSLSELDLSGNELRAVPECVWDLPGLRKLSMARNPVHDVGEGVLRARKLSKMDFSGCPVGCPPPPVLKRGLRAVRKFYENNPSFKVYRVYTRDDGSSCSYYDIEYCGLRDTMVKSKDEDRDVSFVGLPDGSTRRLLTIDRHLRDQSLKAVQKGPGWNSAPCEEREPRVIVAQHAYFGVFDGHCGSWVADALKQNLYKKMAALHVFEDGHDDYSGIPDLFLELDDTICKLLREKKAIDGSTCLATVLKGDTCFTAHAGDCRTISVQGKKVVDLTVDHDPYDEAEKAKIEERGGTVEWYKGCLRINKNLSVTRAFGDTDLKKPPTPLVDARPDVNVYTMTPDWTTLVIASDGVWHLSKSKDVAKHVQKGLTAQEGNLALFQDLDSNTQSQIKGHDNATSVLVRLHHGSHPSSWRIPAAQKDRDRAEVEVEM